MLKFQYKAIRQLLHLRINLQTNLSKFEICVQYYEPKLYTIHLIINDQHYLNETTGITTKVIMESSHDLFDWQVTISMIINYRCLKINSNINYFIKKVFALKKQQQKFIKHINNTKKLYFKTSFYHEDGHSLKPLVPSYK